jgi:DNA-directed RNA polymerase II subunit RPB1
MTRPLTCEEIEDILSCVKTNPRIPEEIDNCNKENVRIMMRKHLSKVKIYPVKIPALKEEMERYYNKTQISAGEMVGVLAATSIGEPTTQLALNSFHSSGISKSSMTTGVPRMQALLNTYKSKDDAGMYLHLKNVDNADIREIRDNCMSNYEYKITKDLISSIKVVEVKELKNQKEYLDSQEAWEDWHDYYDLLVTEEYKKSKFCIVIKFSKLEMLTRRKKLEELADSIQKLNENIYPICSGEEESIILVYVNSSDIKSPHEIIGMKKASSKSKGEDDFDISGYITDENKDLYYVKDIIVPFIQELYVCGIKGIEACYYDQNTATKTWKIETKGSNLREVLNHPMTDHTKTYSSDMWEIFEVFGIEAVRSFLITEFNNIVSVSKRHIIQLVNMMTFLVL